LPREALDAKRRALKDRPQATHLAAPVTILRDAAQTPRLLRMTVFLIILYVN
jgi:hypothetical protein